MRRDEMAVRPRVDAASRDVLMCNGGRCTPVPTAGAAWTWQNKGSCTFNGDGINSARTKQRTHQPQSCAAQRNPAQMQQMRSTGS